MRETIGNLTRNHLLRLALVSAVWLVCSAIFYFLKIGHENFWFTSGIWAFINLVICYLARKPFDGNIDNLLKTLKINHILNVVYVIIGVALLFSPDTGPKFTGLAILIQGGQLATLDLILSKQVKNALSN